MAEVPIGGVISASKLAFDIYQYGWNKDLKASTNYIDFGNDIKDLGENLKNIKDVVHRADAACRQRSTQLRTWNPSSFTGVAGNYDRTLKDCAAFLEKNKKFSHKDSFARNVKWNVQYQDQVKRLRERLTYHNSKMMILLKLLELELLISTPGIPIRHVDEESEQSHNAEYYFLDLPVDLDTKIHEAARKEHPEIDETGKFPIDAAPDAFIFQFNRSTRDFKAGPASNQRTPHLAQYLSLMKCIWIVQNIDKYLQFTQQEADPVWVAFVKPLKQDLSRECKRFRDGTERQLVAPDIASLDLPEEFSPWLELDLSDALAQVKEDELSEEVMPDNWSFDIATVKFIPIYARPGTNAGVMNIKLMDTRKWEVALQFSDLKYLYTFQHLITGYTPSHYDQPDVRVTAILSGPNRETTEDGRLQLWLPRPFRAKTKSRSGRISGNDSGVTVSDAAIQSPTSPVSGARRQFPDPKASSHAESSARSGASAARSSKSSVRESRAGSETALFHDKPKQPLLVLYLKGQDSEDDDSLAAIHIDRDTVVNRTRCDCSEPRSSCRVGSIEQNMAKKPIVAQRYNAGDDLNKLNLALLGMEQRKELPDSQWKNLTRLTFDFTNTADRKRFCGWSCHCDIRTGPGLKKCLDDGHQGVFGQVRAEYMAKLQGYYDGLARSRKTNVTT
ncbi:hypothetical protein H2201_000994 [Coniosporium apollinis]|uniref:Fungal N-terminal domain-containing protein n=1 Tax=Coniosporium apollinis TaxID=61459 RepID=A0ABQ9P2G1_9PEZI|nr:hypothetical protein H2201_000994 [Coniosporium apollinis]